MQDGVEILFVFVAWYGIKYEPLYQIWAIVSNMSLIGINGTILLDPFIVARSKL
mgnify:CR=1 FL=1